MKKQSKKLDVVIPYIESKAWEENEIRYCLRGIEKHVKNLGTVHVIGHPPAFLREVVSHKANLNSNIHNKEPNIFRKVIYACQNPEISDPFLFMNDDHFLLQDVSIDYPFYHSGTLLAKIPAEKRTFTPYQRCCLRTACELSVKGFPILNYDVHLPIIIYKQNFLDAVSQFNWNTEGIGLVMKSIYGNFVFQYNKSILVQLITDCKIQKGYEWESILAKTKNRPAFSIGDTGLNIQLKTYIDSLYPDKSRFEATRL